MPEQEAVIWIDLLRSGWRNHPKALPLQIIGLLAMGVFVFQSDLSVAQWLPTWGGSLLVSGIAVWMAIRFRHIELNASNYTIWRLRLLGWRAVHACLGGVLCALLYLGLSIQWQLPLLVTVVVFSYGLTFYAIEDFGLAVLGTAPIALCIFVALMTHGQAADFYIAWLLVGASLNGWLAGRAISRRLFEAARMRQRNAVLVEELAREVDQVKKAQAQAEQANREKSEFFAAASHDLRQPLYSLQLLSDHLRQHLTTPQQVDVAGKLGSALTSMRQLFERMFDVAKIEAQKVINQPQPVSVRALFTSLDHEFALACEAKGLRWRMQATDDWIWADPVLAQRMLRNLLENAVRYSVHGEVGLRARRRGHLVHCQVWDSGVGISRQDRARVFDDYFQVHNEARRAQDGLGLGLSVVRRLAVLTQSKISLLSKPGKGSCFAIAFEQAAWAHHVENASQPAANDQVTKDIHSEKPCVLVLEDQARVLDAVINVLNDSGYVALGSDDPFALIEQAADQGLWPDALVCDYRLGASKNGLDAIAQLRHELGSELPAILVTGDLDAHIQNRAAQCNVRVMHKPLDRKQLLSALSEAIQAVVPQSVRHPAVEHGVLMNVGQG